MTPDLADTLTDEHSIQSRGIEEIRARGGVVIRVNAGGTLTKRGSHIQMSKIGTSDTIACLYGRFIAIEFKKPGKVATAKQMEFGQRVVGAGGIFLVIDDLDTLTRELDRIGGER